MLEKQNRVNANTSSDSGSDDSLGPSILHWLPTNHPGYELFPNGFPDLDKTPIKQVAVKPLDYPRLRDTQKKLQRNLTNQSARDWWDTTLTQLAKEDAEECETCRGLRLQQSESCVLRTDSDETKSLKSKNRYHADKAFLLHLQSSDPRTHQHRDYPKTILFPPTRFRWSNGSYEDMRKEEIVLDSEGQKLVDTLWQQRQEQETHYVGMTKSSFANRSTEAKHSRPKKLQKGHIVIVRSDKPEMPFYVGEVISSPRYNEDDDNDNEDFDNCGDGEIDICEYGCPADVEIQSKDPSDINWRATFKGTEMVQNKLTERDEYRLNYNAKPSTQAFKPLVRTVTITSIAEFDEPDRMLTKPSTKKSTASRKLQAWVKTVLHNNPRVNWTRPVQGKKRKENTVSRPCGNKRSRVK